MNCRWEDCDSTLFADDYYHFFLHNLEGECRWVLENGHTCGLKFDKTLQLENHLNNDHLAFSSPLSIEPAALFSSIQTSYQADLFMQPLQQESPVQTVSKPKRIKKRTPSKILVPKKQSLDWVSQYTEAFVAV